MGTKRKTGAAAALISLITAVILTACGGSAESKNAGGMSASEIFDIIETEQLCPALDTREELGGGTFDSACEKLYGIDPTTLSDGGIMYVSAGTSADEITVLKSSDGSGLADILEKHAADRAAVYNGYSPAESEKAAKGIVFTDGDMTILVIADNAEQIKNRLTEGKE